MSTIDQPQPTLLKKDVTLTFGSLQLTGDLFASRYRADETLAIELWTDEGDERVSVNLGSYGLVAELGAVFVPDSEGLAQSLADAVGGTVGRKVSYGPFNSSATEVSLGGVA